MWSLLSKRSTKCQRLRDVLEAHPDRSSLTVELQEHLSVCSDCDAFADEIETSRSFLSVIPPRAYEPSPWFAGRVMAAISAREAEFRRSLDAWAVVPRLAAKLTWVSALALLLAGSWLYQRPKTPTLKQGTTESLFENAPAGPQQDDVLVSAVEPVDD